MERSNLPVVAKGLMLLFVSAVVSIVGGVPVIGWIATLASGIISVYALFVLSDCHPSFKTALIASVASVALHVVGNIPFLGVFTFFGSIAAFVSIYMICMTIDEFVLEFSVPGSITGALVWKLELASVIGAAAAFLIPPLVFIVALVIVVGVVFYMMLLYKTSKALETAA
jgi:hypothetical protein